MINKEKGINNRNDVLIDPLTKRWLTGDYSHYLTEF